MYIYEKKLRYSLRLKLQIKNNKTQIFPEFKVVNLEEQTQIFPEIKVVNLEEQTQIFPEITF